MGSKPKSTSTSTSGSAQSWATPLATQGANNVLSVYNANQPGLNALSQQANAQLANLGTQGAGLGKQVSAANSQLGAANRLGGQAGGFASNVLAGKYLNGNPQIAAMLGQINQNVRNEVGSEFGLAGRYGSGAHQELLTSNLADAQARLLYGNYSDEMNRMMGAAQLAQQGQSIATQQQAAANQALAANNQQQLAQTAMAAELPYIGSNNMANSLGALFNGGTSTATQKGPSPIWGAVGAGLGAAGQIFSDRRLKMNIEKVGEYEDGLGIYEYEYTFDPSRTRVRGVMADEVKELRPHAYIENFRDGYAGVNYAAL